MEQSKEDKSYAVIFTGRYLENSKTEKNMSKLRMAEILRMDIMDLEFLVYHDEPVVIRDKVLLNEAETLVEDLYKIGAICNIRFKDKSIHQVRNKGLCIAQTEPPQDEHFQDKDYTYKEYIKSPEWRALREKALDRANNKCEMCGSNGDGTLDAHHVRYPSRFKKGDSLDNIVVVCRKCHRLSHGVRD
ncbi:HNH endonuclease domain protein [Candidatus Magnetobacterium bavaricum]|uniref:HNH endonuclease domain protein n=1 Tax=Candidatus Magnetobacterium bavaricum TaxID=29290 RepID=A0A0F3GVV9_9BACT|nr:HNH endonuclease domain protein [Candidatus Magnetobacterium bavaricum]